MPLWRIFSHPETFSAGQKAALARDITALYHEAAGLPKFYVGVVFIPLEAENIWVGGERRENFVRIVVEQIARQLPSPETEKGRQFRRTWMDKINETLKAQIIERKDLEWELHIYETPFDLWRVQGLEAPSKGSEEEQRWFKENKATPWK